MMNCGGGMISMTEKKRYKLEGVKEVVVTELLKEAQVEMKKEITKMR